MGDVEFYGGSFPGFFRRCSCLQDPAIGDMPEAGLRMAGETAEDREGLPDGALPVSFRFILFSCLPSLLCRTPVLPGELPAAVSVPGVFFSSDSPAVLFLHFEGAGKRIPNILHRG